MSTFIWGKIKLNRLPESFRSYQRGDIIVYFNLLRDPLYMSELNEGEIYFNIACGYEEMVYPLQYKMSCLNCASEFFSLDIPIKTKKREDPEVYFERLFARIKRLQEVILELLNKPEVDRIEYYHTDSASEDSVEEYEFVDWKPEEFAQRFFEEMEKHAGSTPTIRAVFKKN